MTGAPDTPFADPLRVLHVWQPIEAGVPRYAWAAAEYQGDHGWDVHAACPNPSPHHGVTTHRWPAQRNPIKGLRRESRRLRQLVTQIAPDVVVAHSAKAGLVVRATLRGELPTVYVPHAWPHLALPRPAQPIAVGWERFAARWTTTVVAVGDGEAEEAVRRSITVPIEVVHNPVPPGWVPATPADKDIARSELELPDGPIAVCVGRFSRQKGQDVLVSAWPIVRQRVGDATLVLVGDGPDLESVRQSAGPGVLFPGASRDPRPYLAAADIAVLPSRWEGLSLSMLEAMASGRSLVVTDVSGSEVVEASDGGAVVPVDDPQALADAIAARLSGDIDAAAEGRRAADFVAEFHNFDTEMIRLAEVIAAAGGSRRPVVGTG